MRKTGTKATTPHETAGRIGDEPEPWRGPADREGWRTAARGDGRRRVISVAYEVPLSPEQNAWVERESARLGTDPISYIVSIVEKERCTNRAAAAQ